MADGRFQKGERRGRATEFKTGEHWRPRKAHWDREWLLREYVEKQRSAGDIAKDAGCADSNITFWLQKHGIPRRSISEARQIKHWGASGTSNPMYGRRGAANHNWKGGCTPERQAFYTSREWAIACSAIWNRDNATCQRCGANGKHIHHIASFSVKELRAEVSNLVLLCVSCHRWVHSKKNTDKEFLKGG